MEFVQRRPKRNKATKNMIVVDNLAEAISSAELTIVAVAELLNTEYVTLHKYLAKERNLNNVEVAKRMVVITNIINSMVKEGVLPIPKEVNRRYKTEAIIEAINDYINSK